MEHGLDPKKQKQNEKIFKKINESIREIEGNFLVNGEERTNTIEFVCECNIEDCFDKALLT